MYFFKGLNVEKKKKNILQFKNFNQFKIKKLTNNFYNLTYLFFFEKIFIFKKKIVYLLYKDIKRVYIWRLHKKAK